MKVVKTENWSAWKKLVDIDPKATFFHTYEWYKIAIEYGELNSFAFYQFFIGDDVYGLPIGFRKVSLIGKKYVLSPFYAYGGLISEKQIIPTEHISNISLWLSSKKSCYILENPMRASIISGNYNFRSTQIITLDNVDKNLLDAGWTKGHKSAVKKALRSGVEVVKSNTSRAWEEYYSLYISSLKRWGSNVSTNYDLKLFNLLRLSSKATLWAAYYDGKMIYGAICFYHNNHVVYWSGAGLAEYFGLNASHALQFEIIKNAKEEEYKIYDFNPSGGLNGVEKYKKGFGAELINIKMLDKSSFFEKTIRRITK